MNRKKLVFVILLSLVLTKLSTPILGEAAPASQFRLRLPSLLSFPKLAFLPLAQPTPEAGQSAIPSLAPTQPFVFKPSSTPISNQPTITPLDLPKTINTPGESTSDTPEVYKQPTAKPTKPPKPTKKPTPTPFNLTNPRPGKNFRDAANIVGEQMCIPPAMIMATLDNEYGPWMGDVEANWTSRNTYQGSDPHDKSGSTVVPFVAVMQMMEDTWHRLKPILAQKFGTNELSLAVTFDSMAAGGYHLRNISLAMQDKIDCDDWPAKYILYGACRYNGACAPGSTTYNQYAYDVCNAYNRYTTGPKKNCN